MTELEPHECDLFLFSSFSSYSARPSLERFAQLGERNIHGWGIGSFVQGRADVVRSAEEAAAQGQVTAGFRIAMEAVRSELIMGHLRLASRGARVRENNHPFTLEFLGYEWLFMHNGTAQRDDLVPSGERLLVESTSDSARVFEFLRRKMITVLEENDKGSLIGAVRQSVKELLAEDPTGKYNLVLSNGHLTFVVIHHRPFHLATRFKEAGDTLLLSTLPLRAPDAVVFERRAGSAAKLLVINGPTLVWNTDL